MPRRKFDFHCSECSTAFEFKLNTELNGNLRLHCPNCGHVHYRVFKNGEITETRFDNNPSSPLIEDIRPMKSAMKKKVEETERDCYFAHDPHATGFMHRLWAEKFGNCAS